MWIISYGYRGVGGWVGGCKSGEPVALGGVYLCVVGAWSGRTGFARKHVDTSWMLVRLIVIDDMAGYDDHRRCLSFEAELRSFVELREEGTGRRSVVSKERYYYVGWFQLCP